MWIKRDKYIELIRDSNTNHWLAKEVERLNATIAELKEVAAAERARSDIAVDRMLAEKGVSPITPTKAPTLEELSGMFEEDPKEVQYIRQAIVEQGAENVLLGTE